MEIKGVGAYPSPVKPAGKTQSPAAAEGPAAQGGLPDQGAVVGGVPRARTRVQATDVLSEDEKRYLESLFPGALGGGTAGDAYPGKGKLASVPPGTIVDRKG